VLTDYMAVGQQELWNTARLKAYLTNVGSPFTSSTDQLCGFDTLLPAFLDDGTDDDSPNVVYDTPTIDPAPWYDVDLPASADFLGFMPLTITGLNNNPRGRNVTNGVGGGGIFGPTRVLPRTVVVTGLLIGATCCGVEYGMHYLSESLAGCTGDTCDGDCITMYDCCPDTTLTKEQFLAQHRRTFRRAALISGPDETGRVGSGAGCARGTCSANGDIIEVEFTLSLGSPWAWTDTTELLNVTLPIGGTGDCIDWCLSKAITPADFVQGLVCAPGECTHAPCKSAVDKCADPTKSVPAPPTPTAPDASFCIPIAPEQACYTVDLSTRPQWSSDVPMITVRAGSKELRNARVTIYEKPVDTTLTCAQVAEASRCNPLNDFVITYIPANGAITIDGQIGRATIECDGECQTASTVFGSQDGGPVKVNEMNCAQYCVCLETDPNFPPAADANVTFGVSGRRY
jgi:hypothetical protein